MKNENFWPDITADESTKCVFDLFETLKAQLKEKYGGRIQCQFEPIIYKTQGFASAIQNYHELTSQIMSPSESETESEQGKAQVSIKSPKEYKFLIYDERRFFRILDVKLGEYFPIEIRRAKGISPNAEYKYVAIGSYAEFTRIVFDCVNSVYVKDVIRFMLDSKD